MTIVFFLLRYTPFWAVPIIVIAAEFAYIFWIKNKKFGYKVSLGISFVCFLVLTYYFWAGGPERVVDHFINFFVH